MLITMVAIVSDNIMSSDKELLDIAVQEAKKSFAEGGVPIGAALVDGQGTILGQGHNRRVQDDDPSIHGETDAFRKAGRQKNYRSTTMVTTLAPCLYCSGLIVQFGIGAVIIGEAETFTGGINWLRENGVKVTVYDDQRCKDLMAAFIRNRPDIWYEDIGQPYE